MYPIVNIVMDKIVLPLKWRFFIKSHDNFIDYMPDGEKKHWEDRVKDILYCSDNQFIDRVNDAGKIMNGSLVMHNGIKIDPLSYYGYPLLEILKQNTGVHEPQEERVFQYVIDNITGENCTMVELGAYWSFYSLWFKSKKKQSNVFMVEPVIGNLYFGKKNFKINALHGNFSHYFVGAKSEKYSNNITLADFVELKRIDYIDVLHSDIQGFEYDMLLGSEPLLRSNKISYFFISTHSDEVHDKCYRFLKDKYNFSVIASADCSNSYSYDGILVMQAPHVVKQLPMISISQRTLNL